MRAKLDVELPMLGWPADDVDENEPELEGGRSSAVRRLA